MGLLRKLFGKDDSGSPPAAKSPGPSPKPPPDKDPEMIQVFDGFGRKLFIGRQEWRDNVLLGNLEKAKDNPDDLASLISQSLGDGFAADIVAFAEHLHRTDPKPARGTVLLGVVYMDLNRLIDAERVFDAYLKAHGDDGYILTNLAKVRLRLGDEPAAMDLLWRSLETDPNQENAVDWYALIHREKGGQEDALAAYRSVAALAKSWRAQLWLARAALEDKNLPSAEALYLEAMAKAEKPLPADLLMQVSGDLGNNGYLDIIPKLVGPAYDPAQHGLQVGNNLIKANLDLGRLDKAQQYLDGLYALKRLDWKETLSFWDNELAKARVMDGQDLLPENPPISLLAIEAPLWARSASPFAELLPARAEEAQRIAVIGSVAMQANTADKPAAQLSDGPGRASRIAPLFFAEKIRLASDAKAILLVPWLEDLGFVLFGQPYDDKDTCDLVAKSASAGADFIVAITLDATGPAWKLQVRFLNPIDRERVAEAEAELDKEDPGPALAQMADRVLDILVAKGGIRRAEPPTWYVLPDAAGMSALMLRMEQQLAVLCSASNADPAKGMASARDILDGIVQFCAIHGSNALARVVLAQTFRLMKKIRPEILPEFREMVLLLQGQHPLSGLVAALEKRAFAETWSGHTQSES